MINFNLIHNRLNSMHNYFDRNREKSIFSYSVNIPIKTDKGHNHNEDMKNKQFNTLNHKSNKKN